MYKMSFKMTNIINMILASEYYCNMFFLGSLGILQKQSCKKQPFFRRFFEGTGFFSSRSCGWRCNCSSTVTRFVFCAKKTSGGPGQQYLLLFWRADVCWFLEKINSQDESSPLWCLLCHVHGFHYRRGGHNMHVGMFEALNWWTGECSMWDIRDDTLKDVFGNWSKWCLYW